MHGPSLITIERNQSTSLSIAFRCATVGLALLAMVLNWGSEQANAQEIYEDEIPKVDIGSASMSEGAESFQIWSDRLSDSEWENIPERMRKPHLWDSGLDSLFVAPSGKWFGFATGDLFRIWDLEQGLEIQTFEKHAEKGESLSEWLVDCSPDESVLVTARTRNFGKDEQVVFWDRKTGERIGQISKRQLLGYSQTQSSWAAFLSLKVSPDGKFVAVRVLDTNHPYGGVIAWVDMAMMKVVGIGSTPGPTASRAVNHSMHYDGDIAQLHFDNNGSALLLGKPPWNAKTDKNGNLFCASIGKQVVESKYMITSPRPDRGSAEIYGFALSPDQTSVAYSRNDNGAQVLIKRLKDNIELRQFNFQRGSAGKHLVFSTDGKTLLTEFSSSTPSIMLDLESGAVLGGLGIREGRFIAGTDLVVGFDQYRKRCELWSAKTQRRLAMFVPFPHRRWSACVANTGDVLVSSEFRKAAAAWKEKDRDYYNTERPSLTQLLAKETNSQVVKLALAGIDPVIAKKLPTNYEPPRISLQVAKTSKIEATLTAVLGRRVGPTAAPVECEFRCLERTLPKELKHRKITRDSTTVLANSTESPPAVGDFGESRADDARAVRVQNDGSAIQQANSFRFPFPPGRNEMTIQAVVTDSWGIKSQPFKIRVKRPVTVNPVSGRLVILAIGVSDHKYSEYDLAYPAADATELTQMFRKQEGLGFGEVSTQLYVNERATVDNITAGLQWLQRTCGPTDTAIVFIAGHGIRGRRGLYYLPHEGDGESLQSTCLNWELLADAMRKTNAGHVIFLADVCHAGSFGKSNLEMQQAIAKSIANLGKVTMFASSGEDELSFERTDLKHGLFTSGMLQALSAGADTNKDSSIQFSEFVSDVIGTVQRESAGKQNPMVYPSLNDKNRDLRLGRCRPIHTQNDRSATRRTMQD